ncbi:hypothetical protein NI385_16585 [Vibrio parahaemolyticus]|uniref:hypothetical protein n=1 Tax=Vibrio parahaemolyticus TaxID=670 RepID=UPI00044B8C32|nr:hypothetical protein [Vibrio parahaemolyticus]EHJ9961278.1 hypothetical protein [Vibrio parahaemolyticus]EHR0247411.1 hypothetical protein [Vibrio parahaemolyticus]EJU9123886.1 hypothetical protein [Vibrio parahaemolyticus]ELA7027627.1 hypothetical protein [Vibrio parahaemolyticus]EXJ31241.1 putative membrane protein [Vibrio parahaemolyticus VPCR-2009]
MIRLFFTLLTLDSAVAVASYALIDLLLAFSGCDVHLDDLFLIYVTALFTGFMGLLITHES